MTQAICRFVKYQFLEKVRVCKNCYFYISWYTEHQNLRPMNDIFAALLCGLCLYDEINKSCKERPSWEVNTIKVNLVKISRHFLKAEFSFSWFHYLWLLYCDMCRSLVWQINAASDFLPEYMESNYLSRNFQFRGLHIEYEWEYIISFKGSSLYETFSGRGICGNHS